MAPTTPASDIELEEQALMPDNKDVKKSGSLHQVLVQPAASTTKAAPPRAFVWPPRKSAAAAAWEPVAAFLLSPRFAVSLQVLLGILFLSLFTFCA
jgi:hypothetical protein